MALQKWWQETDPGPEPIGLAYFGQINPSIFKLRGESFRLVPAPVQAGLDQPIAVAEDPHSGWARAELTPGYYAVSATLLYGLKWRLYDSVSPGVEVKAWELDWDARDTDAFGYFREFAPIEKIGHSIYVYRLSAEDVARVAPQLERSAR